MSETTIETGQPNVTSGASPPVVPWFNDPDCLEDDLSENDDTFDGFAEHPRDTRKRLMESGEWLGPAGAKVLQVFSKLRYDLLLCVDPRRPFRKRIVESHLANCAAYKDGTTLEVRTASCSCFQGTQTILPKSVAYHTHRAAGNWDEVSAARAAFSRRLVREGNSPTRAKELSWRLLEDLLFWSETDDGFDVERIKAEVSAMLFFGEERTYSDPVSWTEEQRAAWHAEASVLFPMLRKNALGWLPTTVMHAYKLWNLWDLAERLIQRRDPDRGELGNHSTSGIWQSLGHWLATHRDRNELRDSLRKHIRRLDEQSAPK